MRNHGDEGKELQAALSLGQEVDREAWLIAAARAGEPAAWRELYQRYFPRMYTYAYCRIGDSAAVRPNSRAAGTKRPSLTVRRWWPPCGSSPLNSNR